jgi:transforming growth factor-beta-induced protein
VFAPTNAAFGAIPAPRVDWLTNSRAANAAALSDTLKYHALSGVVLSSGIPAGAGGVGVTTLCADCLPALSALNVGGVVTVQSGSSVLATVATPNVTCTNGVVHVVGRVLVPSNKGIPTLDVVATAQGVPALSTLVSSLVSTGLVPALTIGPATPSYTVFAPVNSGWSGVPASISSNLTTLRSVLTYHVIVGRVYAENLPLGVAVQVTTLNGQTLSVLRNATTVSITSATGNVATVVAADIDTTK